MSTSNSPAKPASKVADKPASKSADTKAASTSRPPVEKKKRTAAAKPKSATKATATKPKGKTVTSKAESGRPSWKDIIKECIALNREDARTGVSRSTIKKYAEETYKIEVTGINLSQLNRAIISGSETGLFVLPKGPSGKVKLAPKTKKTETNEVR
ncbi:hypothetical protein K435DRAFT_659269 [Dendrothele bispora CBS 962.96]|uniref:Histone H1 n=1 Tax=Dendrothele bispora (strain CBS 962.96) TaxID=1314807 RepID=A0A4S8MAM6_DENBC|nr:hypothetical protein K435DRAFT_659269 [Dendrothele bispora CBS 962.96]